MSDKESDRYIMYALVAWVVSCILPAIGMLMQFPAIAYLVWKCNMKGVPAIMLLMLGRGNVRVFQSSALAIRLGITFTPSSWFVCVAFIFVMIQLLKGKYDQSAKLFSFVWLLAAIPASIMSFTAKSNGVSGVWSKPIMDFLVPSVYFWAISMGATYEESKEYFISRLAYLLLAVNLFSLFPVIYIFSFSYMCGALCLGIYLVSNGEYRKSRMLGLMLISGSFLTIMFSRYLVMRQSGVDIAAIDERGDTISRMTIYIFAAALAVAFGKHMVLKGILRILPILMVAANLLLVSFVVTKQQGVNAEDTDSKYETFEERVRWKLYGDRGFVWSMGWEEVRTPPYFIKDLREFMAIAIDGKYGTKMLPHNQYLTLIGRDGWWLGLVLSLFIIWVEMRAFGVIAKESDQFMLWVMMPLSAAVFCIVGTTGQSVVTADLWANALVCIVFPGVIYGNWLERKKWGFGRAVAWRDW